MNRPISAAELILGEDGSIYHLHLRPEQVADLIITVGDPNRVELISRHFDKIEYQSAKREFVTHTGELAGRRLTVISTGIGPDNIDIVINELDALFNIDFETRLPKDQHRQATFIRVGTCGSLQPGFSPGDFILSAYGIGLDNLMSFYEYQNQLHELELYDDLTAFLAEMGPLPVNPYVFAGDKTLLERFGPNWAQGITLTSPGFYGPQARRLRAPGLMTAAQIQQLAQFKYKNYRITNFEMETSALYGLCSVLGHRALSASVILANRYAGTFSADPARDADNLIKAVLEEITAGRA